MSIASALFSELEVEFENTRKILERVPEGKWDWKPHEKSMSLAQLSGHIAEMPDWGCMILQADNLEFGTGQYQPYLPGATPQLVERFARKRNQTLELLRNTSDPAMEKIWKMLWNGNEVISMPRIAVLRSMVMNHMIHHRGQLGVYLRLLDVPLPALYGPTADERG